MFNLSAGSLQRERGDESRSKASGVALLSAVSLREAPCIGVDSVKPRVGYTFEPFAQNVRAMSSFVLRTVCNPTPSIPSARKVQGLLSLL